MSRMFVTSIGCIASFMAACASHDANNEDNAGQVSLAVATAPSDVQCVVIQATGSGRTVTRPISVTPGQAITTTVSGLPMGSVSIGALAYPTACSAVTASSVPNWQSDPITQTISLTKGTTVALNLVLRPSASITASIDWQDDNVGGSSSVGGASSAGGTTSTGGTSSTGGTTGSGVTVQLSQSAQTIQGFGISDTWSTAAFSTTVADALFTTTGSGIGLSILRVGMSDSGTFYNSFESTNISAVKSRVTGAKIIGSVWSPPANCKSNNNVNDGGHLLTSCYDSWSSTIANFAKNNGLYAMSLQNEPDFASCGAADPCNGNYPSTLYNANELVAFVKIAGPKLQTLGVKVIGPETSQWNHAWSNVSAGPDVLGKNSSDPLACGFPPNNSACSTGSGYDYGHYLAKDAAAWAAFDIFGTHEYYSQVATAWPSDVTAAKKEVWMTEMSGIKWWAEQGPSSDINNGVAVAGWIHSALVDGEASAWVWWWYQALGTDDNEGLILKSGTDTKRHYTLGNYSKFVRPGYSRVAVTGNGSSDLLLSAYKGTDGTVVVVAINKGAAALTVPISIAGGATTPTSMTPWVTSAADNLASKTAVPVSGGSFAAALGSMTVTTFVGK